MKFRKLMIAGCIASALTLTGCDVEQTQDAELPEVDVEADAGALPEYEIVKEEEGRMPDLDVDVSGGQLPEFDVDWMDVDVSMRDKTVTVPKLEVVMEEEEISVPVIDVNMPDDDDRERVERTLELSARMPHAGYELDIRSVYAVEGRIVVVGEVTETQDVDPADRQTVRMADRVVLNAPDTDVRYFLIGERPLNVDDGHFVYVDSVDDIPFDLNSGRELYAR